jgi:hypothetical protein
MAGGTKRAIELSTPTEDLMKRNSLIRVVTLSLGLLVATTLTPACAMEDEESSEAQSDAVRTAPTVNPSTETITFASEATRRETGILTWRSSILSDKSGRISGIGAGGVVLFDFTVKFQSMGTTASQLSMTAKSNLPSPDGKQHLIRIVKGVVTEKRLSDFEILAWKHEREDLAREVPAGDSCFVSGVKLFLVSAGAVIGCATAVTGVGLALCLIGAGVFTVQAYETLAACGYISQ